MSDVPEFLKGAKSTGFEDMTAQDFIAPFLFICQANSPYCLPDNPLYNQEARPGKIINTLSGIVYDSVHVVPVRYKFKNVAWRPRNVGGGFVASYDREHTPTNLIADALTGQIFDSQGNVVMPTAYYLCLLMEENNDKVIIGMSSTQLKKSRRWNAMMQSIKDGDDIIPMFSTKYLLATTPESNNKGKWYGWYIQPDGWIQEQLFNQAKEVHEKLIEFLPERLLASSRPTGTGHTDEPF